MRRHFGDRLHSGNSQLYISGDHLFYQNLPFLDNVECSVLTVTEALTVPPLLVIRVSVKVKSVRGKKILAGTYGICSTAHDRLGVWDSLNRVNHEAVIFSVLTNITHNEQFYKAGDIVGFFQPVPEEDILEHGLPEARIDEVFLDFSRDPKDPIPGASSEKLSEEDREFLEDSLIINAPEEYKDGYQALIFSYHNFCSKSSLILAGRT